MQDSHRLPEQHQLSNIDQGLHTRAFTEISQQQDFQFLLLCVNTRASPNLIHVDVSGLTNDQYLFRKISEEYKHARKSHEWRVSMFFPEWSRNMILQVSEQIPRSILSYAWADLFARLSDALNNIRLHKVSSGDFVRVSPPENNSYMQSYLPVFYHLK